MLHVPMVVVTGVDASGVLGQVAVEGESVVELTGLGATAALGDVVVELALLVDVTGVFATAEVGDVDVVTTVGVVVIPSGVQAITGTSIVTVWIAIDDSQADNWFTVDTRKDIGELGAISGFPISGAAISSGIREVDGPNWRQIAA